MTAPRIVAALALIVLCLGGPTAYAACGDGVLEPGEECDDGNTVGGDCCSVACIAAPDEDGDGICDGFDNCPIFPNPDQAHPEVCEPAAYGTLTLEQEAAFDDGLDEFAQIETPGDGLGPIFNGASCAECHNQPTIGGSSDKFVTRFGRVVGGVFDPMDAFGGSLIQANGITTDTCSIPGESVPPEATLSTRRDTPPLFGLGLVDNIPDARILRYADPDDRNGDGISGRAHMVSGRVGRFGWKNQVARLVDFAGEAYLMEMGVTNPAFPNELAQNGGPVLCDTVPDPEDDGSDVVAFADFMTLLAPLPVAPLSRDARSGRAAFQQARCQVCHATKLRTGTSTVAALNRQKVRAFSDFLLHDMGSLGDGIAQGDASGTEFRTAPLWGLAHSAPYLHDGRTMSLVDAISAHDGEAARSRDRFLALSVEKRAALITYLLTL